ncbi:MAG: PD-(D/E)XK nuclease family protein, partial [Firmicutes bacterium]|nr:PD-(D/E)XK nuclease family protein [Bacillota bacterium]
GYPAASRVVYFPEKGRKILEERFLFYTGVSSAKEKLFLSFPYIDADGVEQLPSFYLQELREILPAGFSVIHRKVSDILPEREDFVLKKDLIDACPYFLFQGRDGNGEKPNPDGAYLYNVLLNDEKISGSLEEPEQISSRPLPPFTKGGLGGLLERDRVRERSFATLPFSISDLLKTQWMPVCTDISDSGILKIIKENTPFSLTDLEAYGRCPVMFFIERLLKLQPIPEEFTPPDRGTALHRIIADFFKELKKSKDIVKLSSFNENDLFRIMDAVQDKYLSKLTGNGLRPSLWEIEKRRIRKILKLFLQRELIRDREVFLHPWLFEESFKRFTLGYSEEKSIDIKGRIDRVDIDDSKKLALVMDYKTTRVPPLQEIKDGVVLQVPVEMLYVRDVLGIMPVAGEYYSISKGDSQGLCFDKYKRSLGSLGNKQGVYSPEDMELILQKSAEACIRYAGGILGGRICEEPSGCYEACRYPDICRMKE